MSEVKRYNIRMAGIGGQGVVTASHIISNGVVISVVSVLSFLSLDQKNEMPQLRAMSASPTTRFMRSGRSFSRMYS